MARPRKTEEEKRLVANEAHRRWVQTPYGRQRRYELRQSYYDRTSHLSDGTRRRWTKEEKQILLEWTGTDEALAHQLGRSVHSIQKMRYNLKEGLA